MATFEEMTKYIDQKKLITILKRFLDTKATAPEIAKYFKVVDDLDFYATDYGCMISLSFENRWKGRWNISGEGTKYIKLDKSLTQYDRIPEYVTIKKGNKKEVLPTGEFLEYPPVETLFNQFDVNKFGKVILGQDEIETLIAIHEGIESFGKLSKDSFACRMVVGDSGMNISVNGVDGLALNYKVPVKKSNFAMNEPFFYNPSYMISVLKSLKDLKVEKTMLFLNEENPMLFFTKDLEYTFKFALNRLLARKQPEEEPEQLGLEL